MRGGPNLDKHPFDSVFRSLLLVGVLASISYVFSNHFSSTGAATELTLATMKGDTPPGSVSVPFEPDPDREAPFVRAALLRTSIHFDWRASGMLSDINSPRTIENFTLNSSTIEAKHLTCGAKQISIAYHGDSTVEGTNGYKPAAATFRDKLPADFIISNEGVGGATAKMLLDGTDGRHPPWDAWVAQSSAQYIIINHALNDHSSYDAPTYADYLRRIVDIAQARGKIIVLETPNPTRYSSLLQPYVAAMRAVSIEKKTYLIDQFAYLGSYMRDNSLNIYQMTYDGVHPTQKTYDLKGSYAASIFINIVIPNGWCRNKA